MLAAVRHLDASAASKYPILWHRYSHTFVEIADLLRDDGVFIVSYVNFGHRDRKIYWPYSNVQAFDDFRRSLRRYFKIQRFFPTSHNWHHLELNRKAVKTVNMHINVHIPFISRMLAVEYFFICSPRYAPETEDS